MSYQNTFFSLLLLFFLLLTSCDPCRNVDCNGHGECLGSENSCFCDSGYEGDNCEFALSEKFVGVWLSELQCEFDPSPNQRWYITKAEDKGAMFFIHSEELLNGVVFKAENRTSTLASIWGKDVNNVIYEGEIRYIDEKLLELELFSLSVVPSENHTCIYTLITI